MNTERILKKQRNIHIAILIAMAIGMLTAVYTAFAFNISRDVYVMANSVLGIAMLAFELALMSGIAFGDYRDAQITHIFTLMTFFAFLTSVCSLFANEAYALAEYSELVRIMYMLSYCTSSIYFVFFQRYIRALDNKKKCVKIWDRIIWIIVILYNLLIIADIFLGVFYKVEAGIVVLPLPYEIFDCLIWIILYTASFTGLFHADLSKKEKRSLACCLGIPIFISVVFYFSKGSGTSLPLDSVYDFTLTLSLYLAFFNVYQERGRKLLVRENELTQSKLNTTILQANPHFIYNTLGSIEYFCDTDPKAAKKMLDDFTKYLRSNSVNLTNRPLIPFREELENLNAYLRIEMVRFPNLIVEYDIDAEDFSIPCLSIQPLVENAIKHGIGKRDVAEGTVIVRTAETPDSWQISIIDDGVGYSGTPQDGRVHIGIENVRQRLAFLCGGTLTVTGTEGQGTVAEIRMPKGRREDSNDSSLR